MKRKVLFSILGVIFLFSLSGCATTTQDSKNMEIQGLRNRVLALETQLREKDDEINSLKEAPLRTEVSVSDSEAAPDTKQIQTALKNAGYYLGPIDGKAGKGTRKAIKKFQEANGLPTDGKVGKKTWSILKDYLEKKVK